MLTGLLLVMVLSLRFSVSFMMSASEEERLLGPTGSDTEEQANGQVSGGEGKEMLSLLQNLNDTIRAIDERSKKNEQALKKRPLASGPAPSSKRKKTREVSELDYEASDEEGVINALMGQSSAGEEPSEEQSQWLDDFEDDDGQDEKGPPVEEKLAKMASRRYEAPIALTRVKDLQAKYRAPENVKAICIPKVNGEVWQKLAQPGNRPIKGRDFKLSNVQRSIVGASSALLLMMEALTVSSRANGKPIDTKDMFKIGLDALSLLGHANYETSMRRRESLRSVLRHDLAPVLCSPDIPVTQLLFGNEFSQSVKMPNKSPRWGEMLEGAMINGTQKRDGVRAEAPRSTTWASSHTTTEKDRGRTKSNDPAGKTRNGKSTTSLSK